MFAGFTPTDHLMFWGFFLVFGLCIAAFVFLVVISAKGAGDFGKGLGRFLAQIQSKEKEEPKTPEKLEPLINAPNNRDFIIEALKLRKETIKMYGKDPMCPQNPTDEEQLAADRLAASLECLVNKYPDPEDFNKALIKFNKKENLK